MDSIYAYKDSLRNFIGAISVLILAGVAYLSASKLFIDWLMRRRAKRMRGEK